MMRWFCFLLLVALGWTTLVGCQRTGSPPPLSAEQERQLEEQLDKARQAEGSEKHRTHLREVTDQ